MAGMIMAGVIMAGVIMVWRLFGLRCALDDVIC